MNFYKKQPTNRKISIIFITSVLIVFTILSITLAIVYLNIESYQHEVPDKFFKNYNKQSLEEIAAGAKSFVLSIVDYRMSVLTSIYNNILSDKTAVLPTNHSRIIPAPKPKLPEILSCDLTKPNSTIFSCEMNGYSQIIIQSTWHTNILKTAKRMNVIYQNKQDRADIMAKSISNAPDFQIKNIDEISSRIDSTREGYLQLNPFSDDVYGSQGERISSIRTKIVFEKYYVMIQLEVFGTFFRNPSTRLLYSDDANVVLLQKNSSLPLGYQLINNFFPLTPDLNYTKILKLGYAESTLPSGQIIYSYTSSYSAQIKMGTVNYLQNQQDDEGNFVIIVHSTDVNRDLPDKIDKFISNLRGMLNLLLGIFFIVLCAVIIMNACYQATKIRNLFQKLLESIRDYGKNPKNYFNISGDMISMSFKDYIIRPILRNLESVIKVIESKKKKFAQVSRKRKNDIFPLNMFVEVIGYRYVSKDKERFDNLKQKIIQNQK